MSKTFKPTYSFNFVMPHLARELSLGHTVALARALFKRAVGPEPEALEALAAEIAAQLRARWSYTGDGHSIAFTRANTEEGEQSQASRRCASSFPASDGKSKSLKALRD